MKRTFFICRCGDVAHQFVVSQLDDDFFVEVHLNRLEPFWKRIVHAVRYLFGRPSLFGDFDEVMLDPSDADRLREVVSTMDEVAKKYGPAAETA